MKRIIALIPVLALAAGLAAALALPAAATPPRAGALHFTKECSQFSPATPFCTITSSNLTAIPAGSTVVYANAGNPDGSMNSDLVVHTGGANAFGHVVLAAPGLSGSVTLSGGTGGFRNFVAQVHVSYLGGVDFAWDGWYSYRQ